MKRKPSPESSVMEKVVGKWTTRPSPTWTYRSYAPSIEQYEPVKPSAWPSRTEANHQCRRLSPDRMPEEICTTGARDTQKDVRVVDTFVNCMRSYCERLRLSPLRNSKEETHTQAESESERAETILTYWRQGNNTAPAAVVAVLAPRSRPNESSTSRRLASG